MYDYATTREMYSDKIGDLLLTNVFVVGRTYYPTDRSYDPVTVIKRTAKYVYVKGGSGNEWRMLIKRTADGIEYVTDSCVPKGWRHCFTYFADDFVKESD